MTIDKSKKFGTCDKCNYITKVQFPEYHTCNKHTFSKDKLLRSWAKYLDSVSRLPKDRQMFYISRVVVHDIICNEINNLFKEDELVQFTKLDVKMDIFKTKLGEWL